MGETVDVAFHGKHLADLVSITFARKDITAQVVSFDEYNVKARVSIGPHVPAGLHDYCVRTSRGSYVGVFHVAAMSASREVEPNNDLPHAQTIQLPALVDGTIDPADYDVYKFHAQAGELLIADLFARRAGSRFDGTLGILDERGNELDFNDDYYIHKDAHLEFLVPKAGDYFVRVSGTSEQGSTDSVYRLIVGAVPFVTRMLPAGAKQGGVTELHISGVNLAKIDRIVLGDSLAFAKATSATSTEVVFNLSVPNSVAAGRYDLHVFAGSREAPLSIPIIVSTLNENLATAANMRSNPQPVALPAAVTGTLDHKRATHYFAFDASAGQRLAFEVDSMKLGYLDDPVLAIYDADGKLIDSADDRLEQNGSQPPNLDPYLAHKFDKTGRYIAAIRDTAERGDPNYVYRLAIYPVEPDFDLKGLTPQITLYRGKTALLPVRVRRSGGWDTPIEVWADGLNSGITTKHQVAEPKDTIVVDNCALKRKLDGTDVMLPLEAALDVQEGVTPIFLHARGTMEGRTIEHTAQILYLWESVGKITGPTEDQQVIATVTSLPSVLLDTPETVSLSAGKTTRIKVRVQRFQSTAAAMTFATEPPLDGMKIENNVLNAGETQIELRLTPAVPINVRSFRLRSGESVSPYINITMNADKDASR
jgi:hypothetical protein